jgi:hypothetical protein
MRGFALVLHQKESSRLAKIKEKKEGR